ncbi:MAG: DNA polymerase IV [Anaerolineae bacterium]
MTIILLDLDAFFCAVEEQYTPSLQGKPFAVGARPEERGGVASCSYPARAYGIHSAMPMGEAVRRCPDLIIVPHRRDAYRQASRRVMALLRRTTRLVEQLSIDEAFLDVSALDEPGEAVARRLQDAIRTQLDLPCSLGVAANKLVAKIANSVGKRRAGTGGYPNAITVVPPGQEAEFLAPLDVRGLWGIGPKTAERLHALGIETIGDLAAHPTEDLAFRFGKHGADLARRARGIDERPIVTQRTPKSLSRETTFAVDIRDEATLQRTIRTLAGSVGRRLRRHRLRARTVTIKLRWSDFTMLTRQVTLPHAIHTDEAIITQGLALLNMHWPQGRPVRLIGIGVSGFEEAPQQIGLWDEEAKSDRRLAETLDALRDRFGDDIIRRGE